ncbi:hypothetical protein GWI33_010566, partial [Rhynchophorus ferrugineus]
RTSKFFPHAGPEILDNIQRYPPPSEGTGPRGAPLVTTLPGDDDLRRLETGQSGRDRGLFIYSGGG